MTDKDLAQLQLGIYGAVPVEWDYRTSDTANVVWGAKVFPGMLGAPGTLSVTVIVLRGSVTAQDWARDFAAVAHTVFPKLGPVHPGFMADMESVWLEVQAHTAGPRIVIGHSLGAARAAILTGLMCLDGQPPLARVVWGEPKSGFKQLAALIGSISTRSYRNGNGRVHDPVPQVPLSIWPEDYVRASPLIEVSAVPTDPNWHGIPIDSPLAWHNMKLYASAML